ncbi:MAG: class I SAM-dependent methyltransferase [Bacteroidota bacterium]
MNVDNQKEYWDKVAEIKTFTHPIDLELINTFLNRQSKIVDFGCGYGRIVKQLTDLGFENVSGFDTSKELITRGISENNLALYHIDDPTELRLDDNSIDCFILFAVLTCIPSNKGQNDLISLLFSKLKKGGVIYISDYYLQENSVEVERYEYLNDDKNNFGVFELPEGATFRHHTKEWIKTLTNDFDILVENPLIVKTMNGNIANGFQIIGKK